MTSSKSERKLMELLTPMSSTQKLFKLLLKLGLKTPFHHEDLHLLKLRQFTERNYKYEI
jgi:hypothetical protein